MLGFELSLELNIVRFFVMDKDSTMAMKEDSFKTFCITFYNIHYGQNNAKAALVPSCLRQQQQTADPTFMFFHVGLVDIKGRTVVRDVGVFADCGYRYLMRYCQVSPALTVLP